MHHTFEGERVDQSSDNGAPDGIRAVVAARAEAAWQGGSVFGKCIDKISFQETEILPDKRRLKQFMGGGV